MRVCINTTWSGPLKCGAHTPCHRMVFVLILWLPVLVTTADLIARMEVCTNKRWLGPLYFKAMSPLRGRLPTYVAKTNNTFKHSPQFSKPRSVTLGAVVGKFFHVASHYMQFCIRFSLYPSSETALSAMSCAIFRMNTQPLKKVILWLLRSQNTLHCFFSRISPMPQGATVVQET